MTTIDALLLKIVNFPETTIEEQIASRDSRVLRSLASSINTHLFITENQSQLLVKILRENSEKIPVFSEEIKTALTTPSWSKAFRRIEQVKKLYIDRDAEQEFAIFIEFTFSSNIRKILQGISEKIESLTTTQTHKRWQAALTESNIVHLYEALAPLEFEIDDTITGHYEIIKSWSKNEVDNQFLITNIIHPNFQKSITADLGIETTIDQNIINDRSMRYQYRVENPKNPGENLVEYMATRSKTKVWVDKKEHGLDEVIAGLIQLKRLPLLVVFDTVITNKYFENLEILSDALEKNNIFNRIGVYFRLANDESGKTFNQFIAEKNYNYNLTTDTQVACAYLELTEPDLPTTVAGLVQTGVNAIRIVPMFLGVGRHAREDLPLLLQDLIVQHPGVTFELRNAIGEEPEMTRAMAAIALKSYP